MDSLIALIIGFVAGILIDFFVINKGTEDLDLQNTIKLYWNKRKLYLLLSLFSFFTITYFYFKGEVILPSDFKIDLSLFIIEGLRTSQFIVGFISSYLFLILAKLIKPIQLQTT